MTLIARGSLTPWGKLFVVILAAWALAVIVPDFWRVTGTFGSLGFSADNNGTITSIDDDISAEPPIAEDSQIDLHRTSLADLVYIFGGMGGMQYAPVGQKLHLYTYPQHSAPAKSSLHLITAVPSPLEIKRRIALFADQFFGVFWILLATFLVWQKPSRITLGFFLYALWYNPGQVFVFYLLIARWPYAVIVQDFLQAVAQVFGLIGFAIFALRFPHDHVSGWRSRVERALPIAAVFLLVLQLSSFGTVFGYHTQAITTAAYSSEYILDICVIFALLASQKTQTPVDRQRTRWVIWGRIIGLPSFIFADINETTSVFDRFWALVHWAPNETVLDCFYMVNALTALSVAYAVMRHRVIDVRVVVRRAAARTVTWLIVGALLIKAILFLEDAARDKISTAALVTIMVIGVSLLFEWLHHWINEKVDEWMFRELHHASERLGRVGAALSDAISFDAIDRLIIEEPAAALQLGSAAVLRRDEDGIFRQHVAGRGWTGSMACEIHPTDPIVAELTSIRRPIRLNALSWTHKHMPRGTAQPVVAIPIRSHNALTAIALYGLHERGDDLDSRELDALDKLCLSASAAYDQRENEVLRKQLADLQAQLATRQHRSRAGAAAPKPA